MKGMDDNEKFINELIHRTGQKNIPNRIHYYSYLNVKNGLEETYNSELNQKLRSKLTEYEKIIINLNKPIDKLTSHSFYKNYIYPAGYHLERKRKYNFISNYNLHIRIIAGFIFDFIIWNFLGYGLYFPIFTLFLTITGIKKRKVAKKNGKYFAMNY